MPAQAQAKRRSAPQPEEKPAKRTRVSRACDQCRVAREKCDGVQPTCSTCSGTSRECSYTANPKKRGIQPGYIRTLELALAYLFQQNPENETALNEKLAQGGPSSLLLGRGDSKESNKLHRRWRKAKFYTDVDRLLSGGETSRHEQTAAASPHTSDEGSGVEEAFAAHASRTQDHVGYPQDDIESPSLGQLVGAPPGPLVEETISTTMPPDSWKLLEVYFANIQSWLPICEKHDILKTAYDYPTQGLSSKSNRPDSGLYAELWSVLAVASLYGVSTTNHDPLNSSSARPVKLYESAKSLVPNELDRFDMGYIKALLNLVVFNMARGQSGEAWLLVGSQSAAPPHHAFFPGPSHSQIDPRCPEPTSDLESFFDELASLDSATRSDTQPQFMQNLGFGPDASMADLFSEYIPMQSSSFITRDESAPANLDQYNFYDAS
ncbi:unnamed protein product [Alternaria alternata]